jgi:hypothetical protein
MAAACGLVPSGGSDRKHIAIGSLEIIIVSGF